MGCTYSVPCVPCCCLSKKGKKSKRKTKKEKRTSTTTVSEEEKTSEEIIGQLCQEGILSNTRRTAGGIAFDIGKTNLPPKPPRRLEKLKTTRPSDYTTEENLFMAEIEKEHARKEKAWALELKQDNSKRKRMFKEAERQAKLSDKRKEYDQKLKKHSEKKPKKLCDERVEAAKARREEETKERADKVLKNEKRHEEKVKKLVEDYVKGQEYCYIVDFPP